MVRDVIVVMTTAPHNHRHNSPMSSYRHRHLIVAVVHNYNNRRCLPIIVVVVRRRRHRCHRFLRQAPLNPLPATLPHVPAQLTQTRGHKLAPADKQLGFSPIGCALQYCTDFLCNADFL